jgi:hypothetical protein
MAEFSTRSDDEDMPMTPDYSPPHSPTAVPPTLHRSRRFNENSAHETKTRKNRAITTKAYPDGIKYRGQLLDGLPHGKGRMKWPNGEAYVGRWKNGKRHGHGEMKYEDKGHVFVGRWINDDMNDGTMKFPDGTKYVGSFKEGVMYGYGMMTWPSGTTYKGEFRNDERNGEGTCRVFEVVEGRKKLMKEYIGNWENDKKSGIGSMFWPDGDKYEGAWKDNERHGHGVMKENITVYEGNWEDDRKNGTGGVFTYPATNMTYYSNWNDDVMIEAEVNKKEHPVHGHISTLNSNSSIPTLNGDALYPRYQATLQYKNTNKDLYEGPVILYEDGHLLQYGQGTLNNIFGTYDEVPRPPVLIENYDDDYMDGGKKSTRKRRSNLNRRSRSNKN